MKETDEEILALAAAGTAGYVRESAESSDVVRVLEQVMCDELPCSPRAVTERCMAAVCAGLSKQSRAHLRPPRSLQSGKLGHQPLRGIWGIG